MPSFNSFTLIGNVVANPEIRHTPASAAFCIFTVAVNARRKNAEGILVDRVDYFRVTAKNRLMAVCDKYLKKGSLVFVHGELETWRADGKFGVNFLASNVQFLSVKHAGNEAGVWDPEALIWRAEFTGDAAAPPTTPATQGKTA